MCHAEFCTAWRFWQLFFLYCREGCSRLFIISCTLYSSSVIVVVDTKSSLLFVSLTASILSMFCLVWGFHTEQAYSRMGQTKGLIYAVSFNWVVLIFWFHHKKPRVLLTLEPIPWFLDLSPTLLSSPSVHVDGSWTFFFFFFWGGHYLFLRLTRRVGLQKGVSKSYSRINTIYIIKCLVSRLQATWHVIQ